jgi:hypothetical protein
MKTAISIFVSLLVLYGFIGVPLTALLIVNRDERKALKRFEERSAPNVALADMIASYMNKYDQVPSDSLIEKWIADLY